LDFYKTARFPIDDFCDCYTCKNYSPKYLNHLFSAAEDSKALATHNGASADGAFKPGDECVSFCKEKRRLWALDRSPSFSIKDTLAFRLAVIHNLRFYTKLIEVLRNS